MKERNVILIADRNPNVREYLKRELEAESYQVLLADNGRQVLFWAQMKNALDLLILDPDLPDVDRPQGLLESLALCSPSLPVVLHTFGADEAQGYGLRQPAAVVEKGATSIERLKGAITAILRRCGRRENGGLSSPKTAE